MEAESAQLVRIHGLGDQLCNLARDPSSELFVIGDMVLSLVGHQAGAYGLCEPPLFTEVRQQRCATAGVAHVLYLPRHLRRERE